MRQFIMLFLMFTLAIYGMSKKLDENVTDDWEYNSSAVNEDILNAPTVNMSTLPAPVSRGLVKSKGLSLGLAVGGAKDTNNFQENIKNGYLPKIDSITYEGQFYNHYFDTGLGGKECKELFCPSYSSAKRLNPLSTEQEYFLAVGLNSGIEAKSFHRKKLNLVVVLDISGSMGSNFNSYYYDKNGNKIDIDEQSRKTKMEIATESIVAMLSHLKDEDRVGIVLFDNRAYLAKPLRKVMLSNKKAIRDHILALKEQGGTNWSAGYQEALKLFDGIELSGEYENRVVFLTDAMPNMGELNKNRLFGLAKRASERGIHTTFIGIGVDFNNDLVEYVSKTKGANYFSVHSSKEFKKLLDKEFDYMVTPLVYDLVLKLESNKYKIDAVYGSPDAKLATGEIMKVNTLFPSSNEDGKTKGGVILLKLKRVGEGSDDIKLKVNYSSVEGKTFSNEQSVTFKKDKLYYDNTGIRKAILISDFVTIMKNWIIDARAGCNDNVKWIMEDSVTLMKRCMVFPPKRAIFPTIKTWERKSCKLRVSKGYKELFSRFKTYFEKEMRILQDTSLQLELAILNTLLNQTSEEFEKKKDDWQFVQQ